MELVEGRPQDKRIDKEERVYDLLDQLNIDYQRIDVEVKQIIANCYEQAYQILSDNKEKLHETAKVLLEKETITGMEFMAILAPNQLPSAETEKAEEKPEEKPDDSADDVEVK